jgi:hypothetical protein
LGPRAPLLEAECVNHTRYFIIIHVKGASGWTRVALLLTLMVSKFTVLLYREMGFHMLVHPGPYGKNFKLQKMCSAFDTSTKSRFS